MTLPLPTTPSLQAESAARALLVQISVVGGSIYRYTNWTTDWSDGTNTWISCPLMDVVQNSPQDGSVEDAQVDLKIDASVAPIVEMSKPFAYPLVEITVFEFYPLVAGGDVIPVFKSLAGRIKFFPNAGFKEATIQLRGIKSRLAVPMGICCTSTCAWVFGDKSCRVAVPTTAATGIQTQYGGIVNRLRFHTASVLIPDNKLAAGRITVGNLSVAITGVVSVSGGYDYVVTTLEIPPPSWNGASGTVSQGCDKQLSTCRTWNNEARFCGLGIVMPLYNPTKVNL